MKVTPNREAGDPATEQKNTPERSSPPKPSLPRPVLVAISRIKRDIKQLLEDCPTFPHPFLLESDVVDATKLMQEGASEAFKTRVEYYASQSGFCRAWLDEAGNETMNETLGWASLRLMDSSLYQKSVPTIREKLRKSLQARIEEILVTWASSNTPDAVPAERSNEREHPTPVSDSAQTERVGDPARLAAVPFQGIAERAMNILPELPARFRNAFEAAKARAELKQATRPEQFPHPPHLADAPIQRAVLIQSVFFAFCTSARDACRAGDWTAAQVSRSVETAWAAICDSYLVREHGACSEERKLEYRVALRRTVDVDPRWKQHLSDLV
jgi:hypothetical protein